MSPTPVMMAALPSEVHPGAVSPPSAAYHGHHPTPPYSYAPNTKGLLNAPGQNNCFLNSAVQVSFFSYLATSHLHSFWGSFTCQRG